MFIPHSRLVDVRYGKRAMYQLVPVDCFVAGFLGKVTARIYVDMTSIRGFNDLSGRPVFVADVLHAKDMIFLLFWRLGHYCQRGAVR
jgi:hypothetical protein